MIYDFRCPDCKDQSSEPLKLEIRLPIAERNDPQYCTCGAQLSRVLSLPAPPIVPITGRDKVLKTLNKESGYTMPGGDMHRARYSEALAKGLDSRSRSQW